MNTLLRSNPQLAYESLLQDLWKAKKEISNYLEYAQNKVKTAEGDTKTLLEGGILAYSLALTVLKEVK